MNLKTCLRCDWEGDTVEATCPDCGVRPLYALGASLPREAEPAAGDPPEERGPEAAITHAPSPESDPPPSQQDTVTPPRRSARSVAAFVVTALVPIVTLGSWLSADEERSAPAAPTDAVTPAGDSSPTPADAASPSPVSRQALTVGGVRFSFNVPASGWERPGRISLNKSDPSAVDGQDAEAIIFWTTYPEGDIADPCANLRSIRGPSTAELAAAVATAPGTELVTGPSYVSVGGHPATYVVLIVRKDLGCDPGYFFTWDAVLGGAFWLRTVPGDTIRAWIVEVDGKRLFIEAETSTQATAGLEQEIQDIIGSIRFD